MEVSVFDGAADALPGQLVSQLKAVFKEDADADCVALYWKQPLPVTMLEVDGVPVQVIFCVSELALREQLVQHLSSADARLVLLWPQERSSLGKDVLARLWHNEPKHIAPWRMLEQLLGVQNIDPRLRIKSYRWLAEQLLSCHDQYRRDIRFGPTLDIERAWQALAMGLLDYREQGLDLQGLLNWSLQTDVPARVAALSPDVQANLKDWLQPRLGDLSQVVELLVGNGHAGKLVSVGLVCTVLYADENTTEQAVFKARGRFSERFFNGEHCSDEHLHRFAKEVQLFVANAAARSENQLNTHFSEAEQELARLDMLSASIHSDVLPGSYSLRLQAFADALGKTLKAAQAGKLSPLAKEALKSLQQHRLARLREQQLQRAHFAVRLCAWLQTPPLENANLDDLLGRYVSEGGFVDWARSRMWQGDEHEQLSALYERLLKKVAERREAENAQIVPHLPAISGSGSLPSSAWPVEQALEKIVAPLAAQQPVLLLVLDGMSQAVYRELQEDLLRQRWVEWQPETTTRAGCLIAALPSVTKYSRHSLLAGSLSEGNSATEKKAFQTHENLCKCGAGAQHRPILWHKAELEEPGTAGLSAAVRESIAETRNKVLAAVVNAVDDQLSSNAQLAVQWQVSNIPVLRALLESARDAGRVIVLCSDHGHVLDHGMLAKNSGDEAERYKPGGATPAKGEALVQGTRVLSDGAAVVPYSEQLRYANKKMGYHGGASLQELVIPLGVYSASGEKLALQGWREVGVQTPEWWSTELMVDEFQEEVAATKAVKAHTKANSTKPKLSDRIEDLFAETEEEPIGVTPESGDWLQALMASPVYTEMKTRAGRVVISDQQVSSLLSFLAERGGQQMFAAVGQALNIPTMRINGVLAGVQKLLNVDGYPVLAVDRASKTVKLDLASLKTQFEL